MGDAAGELPERLELLAVLQAFGGSTRMVLVLGAFIVGSYVGTWHFPWWQERPSVACFECSRDTQR